MNAISETVIYFTATAMTKFRPLVFSGPSGGGKSTLLTRLFKEFEGVFAFSVSREYIYSIFQSVTLKVLKQDTR